MGKSAEYDLKGLCQQYAEKYEFQPDALDKGLEAYAVHLFAQEEGFDWVLEGAPTADVDLAEYICRSNDLQIDGVLEDPVNQRIMLIQAGWRKNLDEQKVQAFFDVPSRLDSDDYTATGGDQIRDLLGGWQDKIADGYEVTLRFVTQLPIGNRPKLQATMEAKNQDYLVAGRPVTCELYGLAELRKRAEELRGALDGGLTGEVALHFQKDRIIELDAPYRTVVGVIKANELVGLYNRTGVKNTLFNLNIRLPLTSRKVNPGMVATAASESEAPNFFYYNNGVSAVCASYELTGNEVKARRLQIINGAQTVSALVRALTKAPNDQVYVLFRLIETTESYGGSFTDNVIRFNNTQNPVKVSDFFANDEIQKWLRDNFHKISGRGPVPTMYYVYKSGHKPKGASGRGLKIQEVAGLRHAALYGPVSSYREPVQFFDRDLRYAEAFGIDGKPVDLWPTEELYRLGAVIAINTRVQNVAKALRANEATKKLDETRYLYRLSRYVMALVIVGLETTREGSFNDYATLTASSTTFDQYVNPAIDRARQLVRHEWTARSAATKSVQPEYNMARDEATWVRLSEAMKNETLYAMVTAAGS